MKTCYLFIEIILIVGALVLFILGNHMSSSMALIMASLCRIEHKIEEIKGDKNGRD